MNLAALLLRIYAVADALTCIFERLGFSNVADAFTVFVLIVGFAEAFGLIDKIVETIKTKTSTKQRVKLAILLILILITIQL